MKKIEINNREYELPDEVVDYIEELRYYYTYKIGTKVVEIHSGLCGYIKNIYKTYKDAPLKIVNGDYEKFLENIGVYINREFLNIAWLLVQHEDSEDLYYLPYPYWRIIEDNDTEIAERISDV